MSNLVHNLVPKLLPAYNKELSVPGYIKSRTQCSSSPFLSPIFPLCYLFIWKKTNCTQFYTVGSLGQGLLLSVLSHTTMAFPASTAIVSKDFYCILSQRPWWRAFRITSPIWKFLIFISETKAPETPGVSKEHGHMQTHTLQTFSVFLQGPFLPLLISAEWAVSMERNLRGGRKFIFSHFLKNIPRRSLFTMWYKRFPEEQHICVKKSALWDGGEQSQHPTADLSPIPGKLLVFF